MAESDITAHRGRRKGDAGPGTIRWKRHGGATGGKVSREYQAWRAMIRRCRNPNSTRFKDWGGRGVTVCDRWLNSFEDFRADVGEKPSPKHSLDRIKNERGYEPGNVRWATSKEQNNNRRTTVSLTHEGRTMTIGEWADETGILFQTIWTRIKRGWPIEEALEFVPRTRRKPSSHLPVAAGGYAAKPG